MQIFITGATGVLGRLAVRELVANGHQVRGLARSEANFACLRDLGAEPVGCDLFDPPSLVGAVRGCEAIAHLATKIPPTAQLGRRSAWRETDHIRREGTSNLVDVALAVGVGSLVYPSICFLYPDIGAGWIDPSFCTEPVVVDYYRSTLDAEAEVRRFPSEGGRGAVLRMGFFYGPESPQSRDQLWLARWGIASVPGRPDTYHPFVAIADAARAVVAALEQAPSGTFDVEEDDLPTTTAINAAMAQAVGRQHTRSARAPCAHVDGERDPGRNESQPARVEPPLQRSYRLGARDLLTSALGTKVDILAVTFVAWLTAPDV
jgi:nucleoside-diphosphate-sugar epimerase